MPDKGEQTSLPVNLANLKSGDNDKLGEFEIKLNKTRKILNNEWKTDPNKIVINSYIKIMNLDWVEVIMSKLFYKKI